MGSVSFAFKIEILQRQLIFFKCRSVEGIEDELSKIKVI